MVCFSYLITHLSGQTIYGINIYDLSKNTVDSLSRHGTIYSKTNNPNFPLAHITKEGTVYFIDKNTETQTEWGAHILFMNDPDFLAKLHEQTTQELIQSFGKVVITYIENPKYHIQSTKSIRRFYRKYKKYEGDIFVRYWFIQLENKQFMAILSLLDNRLDIDIKPLENRQDFYVQAQEDIKFRIRFLNKNKVSIFLRNTKVKNIEELIE